jgi:hypothetical protein
MARVPIYNVASIGVVQDQPDHKLPPEAWTSARNMRFIDDRVVMFTGEAPVMDPPSVAPGFLMATEGSEGVFWLYASAVGAGSKVYAFNSATHSDISQAGDYNVTNYRDWNGVVFQGTPIINPGSDVPQLWSSLNLGTDLVDLTNWPATYRAKVLGVYKNYLVALGLTEGSDVFPHRVRWSDVAGPGEVPGSWDDTDPSVDAGATELSDVDSGIIIDGLQLRDLYVIYKNESTWLMRFSGGTDVMEFADILHVSGILAPRCRSALVLPKRGDSGAATAVHFLHNGIDLGYFDGQDFSTVVYGTNKKFLVGDIDSVNYQNSFTFINKTADEAWFCYPQAGSVDPNVACVWNYQQNTVTFRDFLGVHANSGPVESAGASTWATAMGTWADAAGAVWQEGARRKTVVADRANTLFRQIDTGTAFNGTPISTFLERTGIAIDGQDRQGNPKVNFENRKIISRVWPKITGGRVRVSLGATDIIGNEPSYVTPDNGNIGIFTPGTDQYVDVVNQGRLLALKFEGIDGDHWELEGYDIDVAPLGEH